MNMKIVKNPRTEADVQLLLSVFPDVVQDGRRITHEQIEIVLKMTKLTSRYRTVVNRWRRVLFTERRVFLDGRIGDGSGFIALTPDEMVRFANREVRASGRKLKKALAVGSAPNDAELSVGMLKYRQLLEAAMLRIAQEQRTVLRAVSKALPPMKQLPRASGT